MIISVLNYSHPIYNLGAAKIARYHRLRGDQVYESFALNLFCMNVDKTYLSAIFTWDLPKLIRDANLFKERNISVELGGPAVTAMSDYVERNTGIKPHFGMDERFEHVRGDFKMEFTSRGCRNNCAWCGVPRLEPVPVEYEDFNIPVGINPYIGDNNILATSWEHQVRVVEKLKNVRNLDINSGFEVGLFTEDYYQLYSKLHLEAWRIAFDSMAVEADFEKAVKILKNHDVDYRKILVYVLIGFPGTTFDEAVYRLEKARVLGCSPYPQRYMPLNSTDARKYVAPGWDKRMLELLRLYWVTPEKWRSCTWREFLETEDKDV